MQANQTSVIWTVILCSLLLLIVGLFAVSSVNNNLKSIGDYPTAAEIAALVVIPDVEYPEFPDYMITEKEYEENLMEGEAERLVLLEIYS